MLTWLVVVDGSDEWFCEELEIKSVTDYRMMKSRGGSRLGVST